MRLLHINITQSQTLISYWSEVYTFYKSLHDLAGLQGRKVGTRLEVSQSKGVQFVGFD